MTAPWRTGRKLGRTLYERKYTDAPSDEDHFLGIMDTPELAAQVVAAVNEQAEPTPEVQRLRERVTELETRLAGSVTSRPGVRGGEACIGGTRVPADIVAGLVPDVGEGGVAGYYPRVTPEGARAAVRFVEQYAPDVERARIRESILAEIDDRDPDGRMRTLMDEQQPGQDDPGHAGNAWWRAYCHVGGLMLALACTEPDEKSQRG